MSSVMLPDSGDVVNERSGRARWPWGSMLGARANLLTMAILLPGAHGVCCPGGVGPSGGGGCGVSSPVAHTAREKNKAIHTCQAHRAGQTAAPLESHVFAT